MSKSKKHWRQQAEEPGIGLDKMGMPIIDPAPDKPLTWEGTVQGRSFFKGGTWGMATGLAIAIFYMDAHSSPFGFYTGNLLLVIGIGVIGGYIAGAVLGLITFWLFGRDIFPPTWIFGK